MPLFRTGAPRGRPYQLLAVSRDIVDVAVGDVLIRRPVVGIPRNAVRRKRHSQAAGRSPTNHASWTCYVYRHLFAAGRPSRVGPYAQGRWPCFLRIAELWQPTFISLPVCDIVGDAQRAYRYGDSAKCCAEKTLFAGPGRGVFYELRVTRSDVVSLSLLPRSGIRRGRPESLFGPPDTDQREVQGGCQNGQRWLASRYALRVSRSVVVSLSLSRRNAASESEKKAVVRGSWFVARKTMPHGPVMYITIYSRRAALWDGPYDAAIRPQKRATSH